MTLATSFGNRPRTDLGAGEDVAPNSALGSLRGTHGIDIALTGIRLGKHDGCGSCQGNPSSGRLTRLYLGPSRKDQRELTRKKSFSCIFILCVLPSLYVPVPHSCSALGGQKMSDSWKKSYSLFQAIIWVLGAEPQSSRRQPVILITSS